MLASIEAAFRGIWACIEAHRMYGSAHPMFQKSLNKAFDALVGALGERREIVIGIIGDDLAFEREILFDPGRGLRPAMSYLKERNIERVSFYDGINREELAAFVTCIAGPKENCRGDLGASLGLAGVEHIGIGRLKVGSPRSGAVADLYYASADVVGRAVSGVLNSENIDHRGLRVSLNDIVDNVCMRRQEMLALATVKRHDAGTYSHMLNVSILSMYFSSHLGSDKEDTLDIGVAAMYHDIGKLSISRKLLHKHGKLTDQEFGQLKSHTLLGAQIMLKYVDTLGILPVVICFEHHLKHDSSGYPRQPFLRRQHIASSVVAICDVYDALSQRRGYKTDYSPDVVYSIMNRDRGSAFDPELLDRFFKIMGLWPVGAVVELSDGSIALVREQNESDIRRPKIAIVSPANQKREVDLVQESSISIQRYLNPWTEGKEYLRLE